MKVGSTDDPEAVALLAALNNPDGKQSFPKMPPKPMDIRFQISFKSLDWRGYGSMLEADAFGIDGFYMVDGEPSNWTLHHPGPYSMGHTPGYETQAGAKAAAQVDFQRRVLASLDPVEPSS